jgi:hypothetical protein
MFAKINIYKKSQSIRLSLTSEPPYRTEEGRVRYYVGYRKFFSNIHSYLHLWIPCPFQCPLPHSCPCTVHVHFYVHSIRTFMWAWAWAWAWAWTMFSGPEFEFISPANFIQHRISAQNVGYQITPTFFFKCLCPHLCPLGTHQKASWKRPHRYQKNIFLNSAPMAKRQNSRLAPPRGGLGVVGGVWSVVCVWGGVGWGGVWVG